MTEASAQRSSAPFSTPIERGGRVLSVCTGAFILGAAGLLDGRRCTTHWSIVDELQRTGIRWHEVVPDVLYVDDDPVITSAGTAAGIDASLHLVRKELGADVANGIARRMVVPPHREGGQAQYIERPLPDNDCETLGPLLDWMTENLHDDVSVDDLADRRPHVIAHVRRRFKAETGYHAARVDDPATRAACRAAARADR